MSGAMIILIRRRKSWLKGRKNWRPLGVGARHERSGRDADDEAEDDLLGEVQPTPAGGHGADCT